MRDTPVPMSNTAVKSHYAGSSWGLPPVRYGRCQAKRSDCEAAFIGSLAQLGEHLPYKQRVGGSNPSTPIRSRSEWLSRRPVTAKIAGSSPVETVKT
jgi:hypothetical protein